MIPLNKWSRPGTIRHDTMALVVHWPYMPMASAQRVYDYFATGIPSEQRYASTQYVMGLSGELLTVMPEREVAYHCGTSRADPASGKPYTDTARQVFGKYAIDRGLSPNLVTVGIEVCHKNRDGEMTQATIDALAHFAAKFCRCYGLDPVRKVLRHHDVVGWKDCPRYWVQHEDKWNKFLDVVARLA